jgi:hypothetical protein
MDLLALTADDLAAITNRGTVKRAQKELEAGDVTCDIRDDTGDLVFAWSDGITCRFPAGKPVHDALCSSGTVGVSRHIVRSVLAYQRVATVDEAPSPAQGLDQSVQKAPSVILTAPWDPGSISDEELVSRFRKAAVTKARKRFERGVLVELTRGAKPTARFLDEACTVRFLVPGDLRYIHADCAESLLPTWVPLAVWAFRNLPAGQLAGLLSIQQADLPTPTSVLESLDVLLSELCRDGLSSVGESWSARMARIEEALRNEGLVWPAELTVDLLQQHEMYRQHDARFEPQQVLEITGELIARLRAISRDTKAVPQPLIRGSRSDRPTEIAGGRMIGVGLGVRAGKRHATLSAYLQDADSGTVVALERTFADPDPQSGDKPRSFPDLAGTIVSRGVSLAALASSQLLVKSGKRTPSGVLVLPRTASSLSTNPQSFRWEQLKPPFAAESFTQLAARFAALPPSYLRPRRRTENLHVVNVAAAEDVTFDVAHQRLLATLRDAQGDAAQLVHPFHSRACDGFNALFEALQRQGGQVRFVCGHVRNAGRGLEIRPISVVIDDGERRMAIQPWVTHEAMTPENSGTSAEPVAAEPSVVDEFLQQLQEALADLLLTGVAASDARSWVELGEIGRQLGFTRLASPIADLANSLVARANTRHWEDSVATQQVRELCLLSRIAME